MNKKTTHEIFEDLFQAAKKQNEFAYVFALLGINSGIEDTGWQPIGETLELSQDLISIANTPLQTHTQIRLLLLLYCQITESSYMYHVLYNMLLCIENESPPKVFNFMDKYKKGTPPSVKSKVRQIREKAEKHGQQELSTCLNKFFHSPLRNAISHADFILYRDELRLKHKGDEIEKMKLQDVVNLINAALMFFQTFFQTLDKHKMSYKDEYVICGRKNKVGHNLMSITLKVDSNGVLIGFSGSDPLPMW